MLAPGSGHPGQRAAAGCQRLAAWIWLTLCCGHLLLPSGPALGHSFSLCRLPAGGKAVNTAPVPGQTQQDESDRKTEPHSSVSDLVNSLTSEMLMVGPGVGRSSAVGLAAPPLVAACWLRPPSRGHDGCAVRRDLANWCSRSAGAEPGVSRGDAHGWEMMGDGRWEMG